MSSEAWMMRDGRKAARREAHAASTLRADGMRATDVVVLDLSETGLRLATPVPLEAGQEISIGLTGVGARAAQVRWVRGGEYGCTFAEPLTAEEAGQAFTSGSVVPIGFVSNARPPAPANPELDALYASHRTFALPLDAVVAAAVFLGLFAAIFWVLVRP